MKGYGRGADRVRISTGTAHRAATRTFYVARISSLMFHVASSILCASEGGVFYVAARRTVDLVLVELEQPVEALELVRAHLAVLDARGLGGEADGAAARPEASRRRAAYGAALRQRRIAPQTRSPP